MDGADGAAETPGGDPVPHARFRGATVDRILADHGEDLRRFLRRRVADPSECDEIVQDSFLRLANYEKIGALENPRAFLFRIAENLLRDRRRRSRVRRDEQHEPLDGRDLLDPAPDPHAVLQHRDTLARVTAAIVALEEPARTAFVLSRYRDMSYAEIADHMKISVKTVEKYISSALVILRQTIGSDRSDASNRLGDRS